MRTLHIFEILIIILFLGFYEKSYSQINYCDTVTIATGIEDSIFSCGSEALNISANAGFFSYNWSNSETSQEIEISLTGYYFLTVTNDSGCIKTDSIFVSLIETKILQEDTFLCYGDSIILELSPNNYSNFWNGNPAIDEDTFLFYAYSSQEIIVEINNSYSVCSDTIFIETDTQAQLNEHYILCRTDSFILDVGTGFNSYLWNTASTNNNTTIYNSGYYSVDVTGQQNCNYTFYTNVEFIVPEIQQTDTAICYGDSILLTVNSGSGIGIWNSNIVGDSIYVSPVDSTIYDVYVYTGIGNCSDTVEIFVATPPDLPDELFACNEDIITIQAESDYTTYIWNNGSTENYLNTVNSGYYYLTASYLSCIFSDSIYVDNFQLDIDISDTTICNGDQLILTANSSENNYYWSTDDHSHSIQTVINQSTSFIVYSSNQFQTCTDSTTITVLPALNLNLPETISVCNIDTIMLFDSNNTFTSYLWNTGDTSQVLKIVSTGHYFLTVENAENCQDTDTSFISIIKADILNNDTLLCDTNGLFLEAISNTFFTWNTGNTNHNITVFPTSPMSYYITASDGTNQCIDSVKVEIGDTISLSLPDTVYSCDIIEFGPSQLYDFYSWSTGENSSQITVNESNIITLTVENNSGCQAIDTVQFFVISSNIEQNDTSICEGEEIMLSISNLNPDYYYLWNNDSIAPIQFVSPENSGFYSVTISENGFECTDQVNVEVWGFYADSILGEQNCFPDTLYRYSLSAAGISNFDWNISGGQLNIINDSIVEVNWFQTTDTGQLFVTETNSMNCIANPIKMQAAIEKIQSSHLNENEITIYPNPFAKILFVNGLNKSSDISIFTMDGKEIFFEKDINTNEFTMDVSKLNAGSYFIEIRQLEITVLRQLIVK